MNKATKIQLNSEDIINISSTYLNEGRKQESWEILRVEIEGKQLDAHVRMRSRYISETDPDGFHLSIFSTLEFLSQLAIIYGHVWAGKKKKTREAWMVDCSIKSRSIIRDPENIRVSMNVRSMKKFKEHYLMLADTRVFDESGLFEARLKGFVS
jgi:hypothetical protein